MALASAGLIGRHLAPWYVFFVVGLFLIAIIWWLPEAKYDRLGEKDYGFWPTAKQSLTEFSRVVFIIAGGNCTVCSGVIGDSWTRVGSCSHQEYR